MMVRAKSVNGDVIEYADVTDIQDKQDIVVVHIQHRGTAVLVKDYWPIIERHD